MTKNKYIKPVAFPAATILVLVVSFFVMSAMSSMKTGMDVKVKVNSVTVLPLEKVDHSIVFSGYGEIRPGEETSLSSRVSGNVEFWSEHFVRGKTVRKGEVLYKLEDSRYQAELKNAEANLLEMKATLDREIGLGKVARSELKRVQSTVENSLFLREAEIKSAYAAVSSAEARLILAKKNLEYTVGRAPFDALVIDKNIGTGQFLAEGSNIATLYNINNVEVEIPIARFDNPFLLDELAGISVEVRLADSNRVGEGYLSRKIKIVDSRTRTHMVVAKLEGLFDKRSKNAFLRFGDFINVKFAGRTIKNVYKVPESLLSNGKLWVVKGGLLEQRDVTVIRNESGVAIISSGLEEADKLVRSVPDYPYEGMPVAVIPSDTINLL